MVYLVFWWGLFTTCEPGIATQYPLRVLVAYRVFQFHGDRSTFHGNRGLKHNANARLVLNHPS
jgi:hypothetical protein